MRTQIYGIARHPHLTALLALRRPGESDRALGTRLALSATLLFFGLLVLLLLVFQVEAERGLGAILAYWLLIGVVQALYVVPGVAVALLTHRRELAIGVLRGAAVVAAVNLLALLLGFWLGVR